MPGAAGGAEMNVSGTTYPLSGASGTVDVSAQGITGTFTVASTRPNQAGFVLSGFELRSRDGHRPRATRSFDNGAGDNLWTTARNWNPDGLPVAPDERRSSTATT